MLHPPPHRGDLPCPPRLHLHLGRALPFLMVVLLTGCVGTFKEIRPLAGGPPPSPRPSALIVEEVRFADDSLTEAEQRVLRQAFRLGMEKWSLEHKAVEIRPNNPTTDSGADCLAVRGTITQTEKGSAAARFWVGMGAGQSRVVGEFSIHAADGTRLAAFTARRSYLGGTGIGGPDMLKLEDLVDRLGQLVAETVDQWLRGDITLQPPANKH